jgi:hypothetical protein
MITLRLFGLRISLLALALAVWHGPAAGAEYVGHALGEFELAATTNGLLIAAPHGTFDANTAALAIEAARLLEAGYVVARQFTPNKVRMNVNRPTEGAHLACAQEAETGRARHVYDTYARLVTRAASGKPLRLYVEIHGNSNPRSAQHIDVATVGITAAQARRAKEGYPGMLVRARDRASAYPELALLIEPLDRVFFTAACTKRIGIFAEEIAPRAVHIEFPRSAREGDALHGSAALVAAIVRRILDEQE